jgi:hypothetical protein
MHHPLLGSLSVLFLVALPYRASGQGPGAADPLAPLSRLVALPGTPTCVTAPDTVRFDFPLKRPAKMCSQQIGRGYNVWSTLQDSAGVVLWFQRQWSLQTRDAAQRRLDSLRMEIEKTLGPAHPCDTDRQVWTPHGATVDLSLRPESDVVRPDQRWFVIFVGDVGVHRRC